MPFLRKSKSGACSPGAARAPEKLKIIVLEGDGAIINIIWRHVVRTAVVKIEDQDREPVGGAVVVFTLPSQGPNGQFPNGLTLTSNGVVSGAPKSAGTFDIARQPA